MLGLGSTVAPLPPNAPLLTSARSNALISQRVDKSGVVGAALKETAAINGSLSFLRRVFEAKAQGASHVPFRDSTLTKLMEPCLSGHGKTLMMVNVAPEATHAHESLESLKFARQVNQCDTGAGKGASKPKQNIVRTGPSQGGPASKQARPATAGAAPKRK